MAGYTRQSTASIINGSSITAPPINAEFNQLLAAFNASSGHGHTGGTGDAPKIPLTTSVSGYLPLVHGGVGGRNNVTNSVPTANDDSGDGYAPGSIWENSATGRVYICVGNSSGAAVWRELVQVDSGNAILPASNNTVDLGNNSTRFQDLFLSGGIAAAGNVAIGGTLTTTGTSAFTGLATFANLSATGTTTITSVDLNSGAIDNAVIGSATPAAGTFTTLNASTSLVAATADINGGTIDGAALGATTPSTGAFTTLGASGTSTLATVDINGGNIDGTVIGASTRAAGSFTTLSTTGQATLATADINGGSIDGSTIGANSASTGAFTTLTASGGITGSLTGNVSGNVTGNVTGDVTGNVTGNLTGNVTAGSGTSTFTNVTIDGTLNMNAGTSATIQNLTAPTNDLDAATKKYVDDEISTLIGDAGAGLDTLGELADALNDDDDFSTTVTNSIATKLPKAGGTMTGAIAMSTNKITGAGDPTSAQDVATKAYTDTQRDTRVAKTGDTMSGALAMGNNKITGLATPTAGTDVTNKTYVDGILGSSTAAATSASNAATSESNAATSETNASNSAAAALTSKNAAATSLSTFQNQYLGAQSSAPTQDPDGSALDVGDLYFDTVANAMKVYSSSGWTNAGSSVNGTSNRVTYTATAGQTVFAATYDSGYIDTFLNGVKLLSGTDFTATNGTSITLASGASVNDVVDIVAYGTFALADHYTRTASDARYVQPTHTGNLDITGTVTSDGLTVDGSGYVYINTNGAGANPSGDKGLFLNWNKSNSIGESTIGFNNQTGLAPYLQFASWDGTNFLRHMRIDDTGDISFYEDTGTTAKFHWDAADERLGLGTSSPSFNLDILDTSTASNTGAAINIAHTTQPQLRFAQTTGNYRMYLGMKTNDLIISNDSGAEKIRFEQNGNLLFNGHGVISVQSSSNNIYIGGGSAQPTELNLESGTLTKFKTNGSEAMRIDSSGNLLVGTTDTDPYDNSASTGFGIALRENGSIYNSRYQATPIVSNRIGNDGGIMQFRKDGSIAGSISTVVGNLHIGKVSGLSFQNNDVIRPVKNDVRTDAAIDLGDSDGRFKDLHLSGNVNAGGLLVEGGTTTLKSVGEAGPHTYRSGNSGNDMRFFSTNGTFASPTAKTNNSAVGQIHFSGHDGSSYQQRASMTVAVDGAVSSGNVPMRISFLTGTTSNTERMRIDSSGRVTMPYQPSFTARSPSNGGYHDGGTNTARNLVFATKPFNNGNHYNSTNGRFTAPVTGHYYFAYNLLWDDSYNGTGFFSIRKNDSYHAQYSYVNDNSTHAYGYLQISGSAVVQLNANEWVTCYANIPGIHVGGESNFTGFLIG